MVNMKESERKNSSGDPDMENKNRERETAATSHSPVFATPLPQSPRSDVLEWQFPRPYHQYVLTGRSRAAWHTSFVIPQLNLLLDAGLCVNNLRPKQIFLTHGHSDHTLLTPSFVKRDNPPDVYCPVEMAGVLDGFLLARKKLDLGGLAGYEDAEDDEDVEDAGNPMPSEGEARGQGDDVSDMRTAGERAWLSTHRTSYGLQSGDIKTLRRQPDMTVQAFACDHTVPCLGYVFRKTTTKLRAEYTSLPGPEIQALRKAGVAITEPRTTPIFAFLGDTTAATLASAPEWLSEGIPVVITECSFLHEKHRAQAEKTKHTIWGDLEPVIRRWPKTTFVLTHFSMRYSEAAVTQFFKDLPDCPSNIVVWADGEAWMAVR